MKQKALIILFLVAACAGPVSLSVAGAQQTNVEVEYKIKAAFLLNFAKFISWPEESFAQDKQFFKICVLGDNPFGSALSAIKSRSVGERKIDLHYINDVQQAESCHLLFISASEKNNLDAIHVTLRDRAVTTVSDIGGFARSGGTIEFVTKKDKLAFKINLARASKQGLRINSSLLNLATEVIQ
ncbi:MAG: DUF4154 domain-containing protein [Desulfobulbaceae bacterium]|nr:DUF4154 domain-containing protein [Desulfobulbaceae bacterium]